MDFRKQSQLQFTVRTSVVLLYQNGEVWLHLTYQERPPPRASLAPLAAADILDLAALCGAPINSDNLTGGSPWLHLGDHQRPPPRTLLAPLAKPSATGVGSRPSEARPRRLVPCTANTHLCLGQRLTLTSLGQCATPAASDLARCARKARSGERYTLPK
ncbi:hypothetical protein TYRP_021834 [Tyrophagus putrescentiae]|nr:hypothetical protein TYRP_021834 [Tyrophagus putrescentiae]